MNTKFIIGIVAVVFLVALGVWFWQRTEPMTAQTKTSSVILETKSKSLGSQLYDQTSNPVGNKLPDTNPVTSASTNPFNNYVNPFDAK